MRIVVTLGRAAGVPSAPGSAGVAAGVAAEVVSRLADEHEVVLVHRLRPVDGPSGAGSVVDQDRVGASVAEEVGADLLVLVTDVPGVYESWRTPAEHPLRLIDVVDLDLNTLDQDTIRPKVEAAARFARTGGRAVVARLEDLADAVRGAAGTQVVDTSHHVAGVPPLRVPARAELARMTATAD